MRWTKVTAVATIGLCLSAASTLLASDRARIPVFIAIQKSPEGFIDGGAKASQKDLETYIRRKRDLVLVTSEAAARVVLTVIERGNGEGASGALIIPLGEVAVASPYTKKKFVVTTELHVGDFSKRFVGSSNGFWRDAAIEIVNDVNAWVVANKASLLK